MFPWKPNVIRVGNRRRMTPIVLHDIYIWSRRFHWTIWADHLLKCFSCISDDFLHISLHCFRTSFVILSIESLIPSASVHCSFGSRRWWLMFYGHFGAHDRVKEETPFRYAQAEIRIQMVVICGPTRYQLDHGGARHSIPGVACVFVHPFVDHSSFHIFIILVLFLCVNPKY